MVHQEITAHLFNSFSSEVVHGQPEFIVRLYLCLHNTCWIVVKYYIEHSACSFVQFVWNIVWIELQRQLIAVMERCVNRYFEWEFIERFLCQAASPYVDCSIRWQCRLRAIKCRRPIVVYCLPWQSNLDRNAFLSVGKSHAVVWCSGNNTAEHGRTLLSLHHALVEHGL